MANTTTLTFAGDSKALEKAAAKARQATEEVGDAAAKQAKQMDTATGAEKDYVGGMAKIAMVSAGVSSAVDGMASSVQAAADFQQAAKEKAAAHARALLAIEQASADASQAEIDLRQATEDLAQSQQDSKQAAADVEQAHLDQEQAVLDAATAQTEYNKAVKAFGPNSSEAKQANMDLKQANQDLKQAGLDVEQAQRDQAQATIDGTQAVNDQKQAQINAKQATLDMADAQRAANPTWLQDAAGKAQMYGGAIQGLVGTIGLLTMAHEALNLSQLKTTASRIAGTVATTAQTVATGIATVATAAWGAVMAIATSPITLIVIGVGLLIAAIVYLATQTQFFQKTWDVIWGAIKATVSFVVDNIKNRISDMVTVWSGGWNMARSAADKVSGFVTSIPGKIGSAFSGIASTISAPFRSAFNWISDAWNNTVGRLSWTVPDWVPGVGGRNISAPKLPKFHAGGTVQGIPGQEVATVLQAGETVISRGQTDMQAGRRLELSVAPGADSALARMLMMLVREGTLQLRTV